MPNAQSPKNEWWGYLHTSGTVQAKRVFYDYDLCVQEAISSPFVSRVIYRFPAGTREEALAYIEAKLKEKG
jgi:hypothetical protein